MALFNVVDSFVRGNEISNSVFTGSADLRIFEGNSNLVFVNNLLQGNGTDLRAMRLTDAGTGAPASTGIAFNCNSISNYGGAGIENDPGTAYEGTLDARFVWWNSPTGPTDPQNPGGTGEEIVDPDNEVVYQPFLTSGVDADPAATGFQCANTATAGSVIISEFRLRGPGPNAAQNEFVEIYNRSDAPIFVADAAPGAGPEGWALVSSENPTMAKFVVPAGTIIPARGHFLAVNVNGYSLSGYPSSCPCTPTDGDLTYATNIPDGSGLALFRTADSASFGTAGNRLDAVGFAISGVGFSEGTPLSPAGGITDNSEHSFVRKMATGVPQDTENNEADFAFVATDGAIHSGRQSILGAPGPENLSSPIVRNDQIKPSLLDPGASSTAVPNRERNSSVIPNGAAGTLTIRRRFTNNTGQTVTRLRFRVVDITTLNSPGYTPGGPQADLRVLSSTDDTVATSNGPVVVQGLTLEEPPAQPIGGGLNSSLSQNDITLATPLGAGASVNVAFRLGVMQSGTFRFIVSVEALRENELSQTAAVANSFRAAKGASKGAGAAATGRGSSLKR
ncbi:MAG: lamin tail domain-containing protein [Acidobacteria bacterium]|nr:lamin tail domain-containing protein [Acidobacteriota bacterium]